MPILFANPAGFWMLLGIPAVLLIHFLQRQTQSLPASTLFLLDAIDRQSLKGRKIDRLRNSLPLWLQLLIVLLLTWLLVEPRWSADRSVHRIVVVLDSSASMAAFRESATDSLARELPDLSANAGEAAYTVIESHLQGEKLYRGASLPELLESLESWAPSRSAHSPEAALRVGRSLAGSQGTLLFVTDHTGDSPPFGAVLLAVGEKIENVGFAGQLVENTSEGVTWQATVRNYADTPQVREWFLAAGQQRTATRSLALEPGETRTLAGKFPGGAERVDLVLEPDRFTRDDRLFLLVPVPKPVTVAHAVSENAADLVTTLIASLENAPLFDSGGDEERPDLVFATYNPLDPQPLPPDSIVFLDQRHAPRDFFQGTIVAANHPLMDGLSWQGLIAKKTPSIPLDESDQAILWQGDRPLVLLRSEGGQQRLLLNFDVVQSNAARLPAFVVLIHRFVDRIREEKIAFRSENTELRQPVPLAFDTGDGAAALVLVSETGRQSFPLNRASLVRAPADPGFFEIRQGEKPLFAGSANFADTREADFSEAASRSDLDTVSREIVERHTVTDPWWQAWVVALLALALATWAALGRESRSQRPEVGSQSAEVGVQ